MTAERRAGTAQRVHRTAGLWSSADAPPALACMLVAPSVGIVERLARSGYDALLFDLQHGTPDLAAMETMLIAMRGSEVSALVRVPPDEPALVSRLLDAGADGVVCANIDSADQAATFAAACRYPPVGRRSFGPFGAALDRSPFEYLERAGDEVIALGMIESVAAVEHIDAILATPGLDGVLIGPADLALSAGLDPRTALDDPRMVAWHERIFAAARAAGSRVAMMGVGDTALRAALGHGADLVCVAADTALIEMGAAAALAEVREALATRAAAYDGGGAA